MQAVVGGNVRYPNLQSIADLFRSGINDTANNTGGSGTGSGNTAGLIMPNSNPDLITFMASAIEELFSDLANVGDAELILDNYVIRNIPAVITPDPTVQTALGYNGYFNGYIWDPTRVLPISVNTMLKVSWRPANGNGGFSRMTHAPYGLPQVVQGQGMGYWEMRQGALWMTGCTQETDLSLRARIYFPSPAWSEGLNYDQAYVPILESRNAIVAKMLILYARRFAPEQYPLAVSEEKRLMAKLFLRVVRDMQSQENSRPSFGDEATQSFANAWSQL